MFSLFFFNATATTEIYTLSLHDALPISGYVYEGQTLDQFISSGGSGGSGTPGGDNTQIQFNDSDAFGGSNRLDRKSTRLNSSHGYISYAVFCLKKKKEYNKKYYEKNRRKERRSTQMP